MTEALKANAKVLDYAKDEARVEEEGSKLAMKWRRASIYSREKLKLSNGGARDEVMGSIEEVTKWALGWHCGRKTPLPHCSLLWNSFEGQPWSQQFSLVCLQRHSAHTSTYLCHQKKYLHDHHHHDPERVHIPLVGPPSLRKKPMQINQQLVVKVES